MRMNDRLDSNLRPWGGTLGSGNREEAPRPVLRGASFAPLAVVFQKSIDKSPQSDLALAAFIVIFFVYLFGALVAEWLRREDEEERSRAESRLDDESRRNR